MFIYFLLVFNSLKSVFCSQNNSFPVPNVQPILNRILSKYSLVHHYTHSPSYWNGSSRQRHLVPASKCNAEEGHFSKNDVWKKKKIYIIQKKIMLYFSSSFEKLHLGQFPNCRVHENDFSIKKKYIKEKEFKKFFFKLNTKKLN